MANITSPLPIFRVIHPFNNIRIYNHTTIAPVPPLPLPAPTYHGYFPFFSLASAWGHGVGIFDRFSGNDAYTIFSASFLFHRVLSIVAFHSIVTVFCNVCVSLPSVPLSLALLL